LKNNLILSLNKENISKDFCNIFLEERILFDFDKEDLKEFNYFVADSVLYKNQDRRNSFILCENIFNSIENIPSVAKKASWAYKWIENTDNVNFATRLIAFAIVEGIFFSVSFFSIFLLKW
jgi:ribonucleotide reductase beta subunit family protein with ferritin-like domain